ncbi:MAG: adenylate kinase [Bacteroidetes bacterium]|nr:adenylate kinase [Bacteroidota bacterium]
MLNIIIFGAPGSGKGTQSERITEKYNLLHISTGDMLRAEIAAKTELGELANSYISKGQLLPDQVIIDMLAKKLTDTAAGRKGVIFDGFPRTVAQAEALDVLLKKNNQDVSIMLELDVEKEELITRLLKRGQETGRSDDNLEVIQNRLEVYHSQTTPVMDYYKAAGKYTHIKGTGTIDEIFGRISTALDKAAN